MHLFLSGIVSQELYYLFFGGSNWASSSRKIGMGIVFDPVKKRGFEQQEDPTGILQ